MQECYCCKDTDSGPWSGVGPVVVPDLAFMPVPALTSPIVPVVLAVLAIPTISIVPGSLALVLSVLAGLAK